MNTSTQTPNRAFAHEISSRRRTAMLCATVVAGLKSTAPSISFSAIVPSLYHGYGLSLSTASLLMMTQLIGSLLASIPWGIMIDKYGERSCMCISQCGSTIGLLAVSYLLYLHAPWIILGIMLAISAVVSGATASSGGRLIAGWYNENERGRAIAIRQTAPPAAVALCTLTVPEIARVFSPAAAMLVPAGISLCGFILVWIFVINPPTSAINSSHRRKNNPYRGSKFLLCVHAVSAILAIPQQILWMWMPIWLPLEFNYSPLRTGIIISVTQTIGAFMRIGAGWWSDRIHNRLEPVKIIAKFTIVFLILIVICNAYHSRFAILMACIATIFSVADNALEFTAVSEFAGRAWGARALSIHSTTQTATTIIFTGPFGKIIELYGYTVGFGILTVFPLIALFIIPQDKTQEIHAEQNPIS